MNALKNLIILSIVVIFLLSGCGGYTIIGNKESKVLHLSTCRMVKTMKWHHRRSYRSIELGLKDGYSVCDICIDVERKKK